MAKPPNPNAVELGRLGGQMKTEAQRLARAANGRKGGRARLFPRCARCEAAKRTCYHR
jgi:hypothetical protein